MSIKAKIIADSIAENGKRLTTFEIEYPRFIHSEFMTHRSLSKNAASSRAIPISATIKQILDDPAMPVYWGKNQSGMSAKEELSSTEIIECKQIWAAARDAAIVYAKQLSEAGLHKQIVNRILEPWVNIKVVVSGTEWANFFHLRRHKDAQPEIHALANAMWNVYSESEPKILKFKEWHLPYVSKDEQKEYSIEDCVKLSASLCAQVSFRKSDESIEKALMIYDRLVTSTPVHASPFEHQAWPAADECFKSGNFIGWNQNRQYIKNNVCKDYEGV